MKTLSALLRKTAAILLVLGIMLVIGMDDMVEMIWGAFTRFEGVPDFSVIGFKMIFGSIAFGLLGIFTAVAGAVTGSPDPATQERS